MNFKKGFTLIELLVVTGIIAVLAAVILALLSGARDKGSDGAIKSNLANLRSQAEVFYNTNTASLNTYTGVCTNPGPVGGAKTLYAGISAAAKASTGSTTYDINNASGSASDSTCNESATAWAVEVPLKSVANGMWCVDSIGKSEQTTTATSIGAGTTCP